MKRRTRTKKNRKTRKNAKKGGKQKIQTLFQQSLLDPNIIRYKTLITGNKDISTSDEVEEYLQSLRINPKKSNLMYLKENDIEYKENTATNI